MSKPVKDITAPASSWARFNRWIRSLDEMIHYDPGVELGQKVERLHLRIAELEASRRTTAGK